VSDFIGAGWTYPVGVTHGTHQIALNTGHARIEQSMRIILGTAPGERPMRPEFGCAIHELAFAPLDMRLLVGVERRVESSLQRWEPRIAVRGVRAAIDPGQTGRLNVSIDYLVRETNSVRNLVFPFYTLGEEAA
jgi:phage baseplate assembly protein W